MSDTEHSPVVLITGGSAGLGLVVAEIFLTSGYRIVIAGRDESRLNQAKAFLNCPERVFSAAGDLSDLSDARQIVSQVSSHCGRLDVLVNCVGESDRGLAEDLSSERVVHLIKQNVLTTLHCSQAALPLLEKSNGVIVNIGSLASKVGARYLGGYPIAKHALAGLTQQMRLELKSRGVHVALVSPGPIQRQDAGLRYQSVVDERVPSQAARPGGGTKVKGLAAAKVAQAVLKCVEHRRPDVILPSYLRLLITIGHLSPRLGDWLLLKFTSSSR